MKLKKVAALYSQTGGFCLFDKRDGETATQWLEDGYAAYPISGMPYMEKDNICAMFNITEKKREKLIFHHSSALENINRKDTDPMEQELDAPELRICREGRELLPLQTSDGVTFIQAKYLTPLGNPDYMRLHERRDKEGGVYIAVKIGLVIQAIIMPVDIVNKQFVDQMEEIFETCRWYAEFKGVCCNDKSPYRGDWPDNPEGGCDKWEEVQNET